MCGLCWGVLASTLKPGQYLRPRVQGLGFGVQGLGVSGLGVWGLGLGGLGLGVWGFGLGLAIPVSPTSSAGQGFGFGEVFRGLGLKCLDVSASGVDLNPKP